MADKVLKTNQRQVGKASKHILERQRRARINNSLHELKNLVLSSLYQDNPQVYFDKSRERLDKAEILDLTVNFLKQELRGARMEETEEPETKFPLIYRERFADPQLPERITPTHTLVNGASCYGCVNRTCTVAQYGAPQYGIPTPPPSPPTRHALYAGQYVPVHFTRAYRSTAEVSDEPIAAKTVNDERYTDKSEVWRPW